MPEALQVSKAGGCQTAIQHCSMCCARGRREEWEDWIAVTWASRETMRAVRVGVVPMSSWLRDVPRKVRGPLLAREGVPRRMMAASERW